MPPPPKRVHALVVPVPVVCKPYIQVPSFSTYSDSRKIFAIRFYYFWSSQKLRSPALKLQNSFPYKIKEKFIILYGMLKLSGFEQYIEI